jgi:hypothetical protein
VIVILERKFRGSHVIGDARERNGMEGSRKGTIYMMKVG